MRFNWTTGLLGAAMVGVFAIWFAIEHKARLKLADEQRGLEQQVGQMLAWNQPLSNPLVQPVPTRSLPEHASRELLRLRGQVGVLRRQAQDLEGIRSENRRAHAALESASTAGKATADYWPRTSWAFAGFASPEACLQSSIWASDSGDLKSLLAGATGEMRKMVEHDLEGQSEEEASIRAKDQVFNLECVRVLNREVQAEDAVVLTAAFEERTGTNISKLLLKKIGNDWKLAGPAE